MALIALNIPRISIKLKNFNNNIITKRYFSVSSKILQRNFNKKEQQEHEKITLSPNFHQSEAVKFNFNEKEKNTSSPNFPYFFTGALNTKLKLSDLYENLMHLEDVQMAQNKVIESKDKLMEVHNLRIKASEELFNIQQEVELLLIHISKLDKLDIKTIEFYQKLEDLRRIEDRTMHQFKSYDEKERLQLTCFISSMHSSLEKQDIYRLTVSFWYKIFAVLWAALTIGASMIGYRHYSQIPHVMVSLAELRKEVVQQKPEGWGSYISRHSSNVYRYFIPKRN